MLRRLKAWRKRRLEARCQREKERGFGIAIRMLILEGRPVSCVEHLRHTHYAEEWPSTPERMAFMKGAEIACHFMDDHREYWQSHLDFHSSTGNWCKNCLDKFNWRGVRCGKAGCEERVTKSMAEQRVER